MPDVFVSYAREDRPVAARLAAAMDAKGWTLWWDRAIPPGRSFDEVIEEALTSAKCVLVLWSSASVRSRWVRAEASEAAERGLLIPVLVAAVEPPLEFRNVQAADLTDWQGDPDHPELRKLFATIASVLQTPPREAATIPPLPRPSDRMPPALKAALIAAAGVLAGGAVMFVLQRPAFDAAGPVDPSARGGSGSQATTANPAAAAPSTTASATPVVPPSATAGAAPPSTRKDTPADASRVNLLAAANGGHLVRAPNQEWMEVIDGTEGWAYLRGEEAVYGFKDDRRATFDTFTMLITETRDWNIKSFELLASDLSTGEFRSLGVFETQNVRLFPSAWQAFTFPPTTAKYLKVRVRDLFKSSSNTQAEQWQLFGKVE